jgi:hypothetical protein
MCTAAAQPVPSLPSAYPRTSKAAHPLGAAPHPLALPQLSPAVCCLQDVVHGRMAGSDLIQTIASASGSFTAQDKLRLLMCFLVTHPGDCDGDKLGKLVNAAGLGAEQVQALRNLELLGVMLTKTCAQHSTVADCCLLDMCHLLPAGHVAPAASALLACPSLHCPHLDLQRTRAGTGAQPADLAMQPAACGSNLGHMEP